MTKAEFRETVSDIAAYDDTGIMADFYRERAIELAEHDPEVARLFLVIHESARRLGEYVRSREAVAPKPKLVRQQRDDQGTAVRDEEWDQP